jgi:hypothetical protein
VRFRGQIERASLVGIAVAAALWVIPSGSAVPQVNGLTINVTYSANSISAKLSNGTTLSTGTVVPPGLYSVVVYDSVVNSDPAFTMTGPGTSVSSDLAPDGMGIEVPVTFGPFTLAPSSSYVISDTNMSGAQITFSTAATGTSASADPSTGGTSPNGSAASSAKGTLGTLAMSLGTVGKPILTMGGKPVKTLKHGTYSLIVGDASKKGGLLIGHGTTHPITLSGTAAVGTSLRTLSLTPGRWFFETSSKGPKVYFTVS